MKPPEGIDGVSILPAILGNRETPREFLYWEFPSGGYARAVRHGRWKAVCNRWGGPLELYDLGNDPGETTDVARRRPDVVARIEAYLRTARTESANWPVPKPKTD